MLLFSSGAVIATLGAVVYHELSGRVAVSMSSPVRASRGFINASLRGSQDLSFVRSTAASW